MIKVAILNFKGGIGKIIAVVNFPHVLALRY